MVRPVRASFMFSVLVLATLAGCVTPSDGTTPAGTLDAPNALGVVTIVVSNTMAFSQSVVTEAVGLTSDLYEPTMEVSDTGTIYVAGHVIGAATTGTPAYYSNDDGKSWSQLPFLSSVSLPAPIQGSQPPPGDEGFIVAGENGQAWMADIYAAGFSITGWCDNGKTQCYDNRQAYDRVESTTTCTPVSLNDRPWAAYANGTLLLVNNPGGGPMQIGVMKVPPAAPAGIAGVNGPTWNMCASKGGGIPGIPAMRGDLTFAVPQMDGDKDTQVLNVVIGNAANIKKVEVKEVFHVTDVGDGTSNGGRTAFDKEGTLFVGAQNNTVDKPGTPGSFPLGGGTAATIKDGQFILAVSTDGGQSFKNATFNVGPSAVQSVYLDGNMNGAGALLSWSQVGTDKTKADWFVAHVFVGADGLPVLRDVTLAVDEGPPYSAHVMGAAAGPDGRAYFLNFADSDPVSYVGSTPMSVWVQQEGATLPVTAPVE